MEALIQLAKERQLILRHARILSLPFTPEYVLYSLKLQVQKNLSDWSGQGQALS